MRRGAGGRHLIVFDVDGTLTRTNEVDGRCYAQALSERLGATIDTDWAGYRHATDTGIAVEAFERRLGRPPTDADLAAVRDRFLALLREAAEAVQEVPGAGALLRTLRAKQGTTLAIATGAWRESAEWKLRGAAIPVEGIAMATGDDCPSREGIIRLAARRAGATVDRAVYVGDGPWDVAATRRLGIGFVGIADDRDPALLTGLGATTVLRDFRDVDGFLRAVGFPVP